MKKIINEPWFFNLTRGVRSIVMQYASRKSRIHLLAAIDEAARRLTASSGDESGYSDLKLIDELLCDIKSITGVSQWVNVEQQTSVTQQAMRRLREAYRTGEITAITLGLATYFEAKPEQVK